MGKMENIVSLWELQELFRHFIIYDIIKNEIICQKIVFIKVRPIANEQPSSFGLKSHCYSIWLYV